MRREMDDLQDNNIRHRETEETMQENFTEKSIKNTSWYIERPLYIFLPYLHMRWRIRVYYFFAEVVFFSLLGAGGELFNLEFLAGKRSIFNEVFVKFGWGWTLFFILLLRLCCLPLHSNWRLHLKNLLTRVTSLTIFFYIFCQVLFPVIEEWTGMCVKNGIIVDSENIDKKHCLKRKGHSFYSLDISGHSYLMSYCIFSLMEESKELIYVLFLGQFLRKSNDAPQDTNSLSASLSHKELKSLERNYLLILPLVVISTVVICSLSLLWDVMLIVTTLYYHTFIEKVFGLSLGLCTSFLQYHIFFPAFSIL